MKKIALLLTLAAVGCRGQPPAARPVVSEHEKTLHAVGLVLARNIEVFQFTPEELERVIDGIRAGAAGKPAIKLDGYQVKADELAAVRMAGVTEKRKTSDAKFVAELAKDPEAERDPSGLVYIPVVEGTGPSPTPTDMLEVHFTGRLTDGTEFDSSVHRGAPIKFTLDGVIPCWSAALKKMRVGGKAKLVCPSSLAYGDSGHPPGIPGGATLVFEVELLGIGK